MRGLPQEGNTELFSTAKEETCPGTVKVMLADETSPHVLYNIMAQTQQKLFPHNIHTRLFWHRIPHWGIAQSPCLCLPATMFHGQILYLLCFSSFSSAEKENEACQPLNPVSTAFSSVSCSFQFTPEVAFVSVVVLVPYSFLTSVFLAARCLMNSLANNMTLEELLSFSVFHLLLEIFRRCWNQTFQWPGSDSVHFLPTPGLYSSCLTQALSSLQGNVLK